MADIIKENKNEDESASEDSYQLTYFNFRGVAEPIRLIFKLKEIPFQDIRLEKDETWIKEHKQKYPYGVLPALKINGYELTQSISIARYLARKYNLVGRTEMEAALCDELVDSMAELRFYWRSYWREIDFHQKEIFKTALLQYHFPKFFGKYTNFLEINGGDWLVSSELTWADLYIAHFLEFFQLTVDPTVLDEYAKLKEFKTKVFSIPQIKAWIEVRPKTII